jgi:hypothetical protein
MNPARLTLLCIFLSLLFSCNPNKSCKISVLNNRAEILKYNELSNTVIRTSLSHQWFEKATILCGSDFLYIAFYIDDIFYAIQKIGDTLNYRSGKKTGAEMKTSAYASFVNNNLNYSASEFVFPYVDIRSENGLKKCFLRVYYYSNITPQKRYLFIRNLQHSEGNYPDTLFFDKVHPVQIQKEDPKFPTSRKALNGETKLYPAFYIKEVEISNLEEGENTISGEITSFYTFTTGKEKNYLSPTLYFKVNIFSEGNCHKIK